MKLSTQLEHRHELLLYAGLNLDDVVLLMLPQS